MEEVQRNKLVAKKPIDYLKYVPLGYPILVLVGYLNTDFYYQKFGVDILPFLETSELLFSFINLMYPLIIYSIAFWILIYVVLEGSKSEMKRREEFKQKALRSVENQKKQEKELPHESFFNLMKILFKDFSFENLGDLMLRIIVFIIQAFLWCIGIIFALIYLYYLIDTNTFQSSTNNYFIDNIIPISILWYLLITIYITFRFDKINKRTKKEIYISLAILLFISNLNIYQGKKASDVFNNLNKKEVRFNYEGENINTKDSKTLIGITKNYLFLRDTKQDVNLIYKLSEVSGLASYQRKK